MTGRSEALVVTDRPARYGKQLVAHLSRRNAGEWSDSDQRGWIEFADGRAELSCGSDGLHLAIEGDPEKSRAPGGRRRSSSRSVRHSRRAPRALVPW
jgi:hypothetical protein